MKANRIAFACLLAWLLAACAAPAATVAAPPAAGAAPSAPGPGTLPLPTRLPVTWSGLGGRLVYVAGFQQDYSPYARLESLDLASGVVTTLYQTPPAGWIYAAAVSPDRAQIVLSYASPTGYPALYRMPADGSAAPVPLFAPPTANDGYTEPAWSPDGKYIYFVHTHYALAAPTLAIERTALTGGAPELLVANAEWPRLSAGGSRLAYVSADPAGGADRLFVSAADGSDPRQVVLTGAAVPDTIDAPLFLPGGQTLLFAAPIPAQSFAPDWLDWLLGVQVASAHGLPSEWWSVPVSGGAARQLTHVQAAGLVAALSPDGAWLASISESGIFVMRPDGSGLTVIVGDVGNIAGTVDWIP
jgi:Tol biopolymer transport system component